MEAIGQAWMGAGLLITIALSCSAWIGIGRAWITMGASWLPPDPRPRAVRPRAAVWFAGLWVLASLADQLWSEWSPSTREIRPEMLVQVALLSGIVLLAQVGLLCGLGRLTRRDLGYDRSRERDSVRLAGATLLLVVAPTAGLLVLSMVAGWRTPETQHTLLQLLRDHPEPQWLALLALIAVGIAPFSEELMFRVTLQGWLTERLGGRWSLPIVAVLFALMHGWRDGLALLPLAGLLGYVYHRRHDFAAIVLTHALFNGVNLLLALHARPPS
jgi:hypothetical protein